MPSRMRAGKIVAHNLRKLRVKSDLSQENLAVDAGIDRTYVSRLERGVQNPSVVVLEKLATALGVKIGDLFLAPRAGEKFPNPLRGGRKKLR